MIPEHSGYSAVYIIIDNGEVMERITEMGRQSDKRTSGGSDERRNRSCVNILGSVCIDEKDTEGH